MVAWPADLPQSPLISGFEIAEGEALVRTTMEAGVDKIRRRYTAVAIDYTWPLILSNAQKTSLGVFYQANGALPFDMFEPALAEIRQFRFIEAPSYIPLSHAHWATVLNLEMLP